jgi:hypothetical protein
MRVAREARENMMDIKRKLNKFLHSYLLLLLLLYPRNVGRGGGGGRRRSVQVFPIRFFLSVNGFPSHPPLKKCFHDFNRLTRHLAHNVQKVLLHVANISYKLFIILRLTH